MTRKCFCLTMLSMALLTALLLGCSSAPAEPTPTVAEMGFADTEAIPAATEPPPMLTEVPPTPTEPPPTPTEPPPTPTEVPPTPDPALSIVWSDDFEDGDFAGWEEYGSTGFYYVDAGALMVGPDSAGDIVHRTEVAHGTWSFDVFISDQLMAQNRIGVMYDEGGAYGLGILIKTKQNTVINYFQQKSGVESVVGTFEMEEQLSGWHHFDITRDEAGYSTVYLNGEPTLEHADELSITPYWFYFSGPVGSGLDNVIVRDIVIDS
jgi:hypothetical protein